MLLGQHRPGIATQQLTLLSSRQCNPAGSLSRHQSSNASGKLWGHVGHQNFSNQTNTHCHAKCMSLKIPNVNLHVVLRVRVSQIQASCMKYRSWWPQMVSICELFPTNTPTGKNFGCSFSVSARKTILAVRLTRQTSVPCWHWYFFVIKLNCCLWVSERGRVRYQM
jgi:hypothetical protein